MNLHIFQHVDFEGPGRIAAWALDRKCHLSTTRFYRNESLPEMEEIDGLVIMGGPMNIYQIDQYPWLSSEKDFISNFLATGKPILGVCLGAQLLADVLGGRVFAHHLREIGWAPVDFTSMAKGTFPSLPATHSVLHWHGDTYEMPPGARRFAHNKWCAEQGFLWGDQVLALQFHLEVGVEECALLLEHAKADLAETSSTVQTAAEIVDGAKRDAAAAEETLYLILDGLFKPAERALSNVIMK